MVAERQGCPAAGVGGVVLRRWEAGLMASGSGVVVPRGREARSSSVVGRRDLGEERSYGGSVASYGWAAAATSGRVSGRSSSGASGPVASHCALVSELGLRGMIFGPKTIEGLFGKRRNQVDGRGLKCILRNFDL
jgi:hypothetical protein